jgi:hypothetical protein
VQRKEEYGRGAPTGSSLSLKGMIRKVQEELEASEEERKKSGQEALFEFDKVDLEVNFVVTKASEAKGGFSFQVLTFGGFNVGLRDRKEDQSIHKITLSLKAIAPEDRPQSETGRGAGVSRPPKGMFPAPTKSGND